MSLSVLEGVLLALGANSFVAFGFAFFWQAKVILTINRSSSWKSGILPHKALADPESATVRFGRFMAGEIFPDLRRKWSRALLYLVLSVMALIAGIVIVGIIDPEVIS